MHPEYTPRRITSFWNKADTSGPCWRWHGDHTKSGYGTIRWDGRNHRAHRIAYQLCIGPIPDGYHALHRCDVRDCVNPAHLFLGTQADNMHDMYAKERQRPARGEANHKTTLTTANVAEIRRLYAEGKSLRAIGRELGISHNTVGGIVRRRTWKHVT